MYIVVSIFRFTTTISMCGYWTLAASSSEKVISSSTFHYFATLKGSASYQHALSTILILIMLTSSVDRLPSLFSCRGKDYSRALHGSDGSSGANVKVSWWPLRWCHSLKKSIMYSLLDELLNLILYLDALLHVIPVVMMIKIVFVWVVTINQACNLLANGSCSLTSNSICSRGTFKGM